MNSNYNFNNQPYSRSDNFPPNQRNDWFQSYNQPVSNKIYVTSLEDALNRNAPRSSEMVYFHQDANEFYVIKTDYDGRKSWMRFPYSIPNQDSEIPATKADLNALMERIKRLEEKSEVNADAESDGQRSV